MPAMPWLGEASERARVGGQNNSVTKCWKTNKAHNGPVGCLESSTQRSTSASSHAISTSNPTAKPTPLMPPFLENMKTYPHEISKNARQDVEQCATKTGAKTLG